MEQHHASLALENSKKIPDPTISLGARVFNETDEQAFILGVSVPIPFFNRNQGNILEAKHRLNKAENEHKAARIKISKDLAQAYHTLSNAYNEARALQEEVLPSARWVFNAAQAGYLEGKFDYLDVLDAQRTLFESKARYVNVLAAYHKTKAGVERLIGTTLENLKTSGEFRKEVNDE
jgi:cobalt-zinc-cadmium efflux system outer membrane protein